MKRSRSSGPVDPAFGNSFGQLIDEYHRSTQFQQLAPATQKKYEYLLNIARDSKTLAGMCCRDVRVHHVQAYINAFANTPAQQGNAKSVIQALQKWAIAMGYLEIPITIGLMGQKSTGHRRPWQPHHVETAIKVLQHKRPDLVRFILLAAHTGQRCSDLITMRWQHVRTEGGYRGIQVHQKKTRKKRAPMWIPFLDDLADAIEVWEREYKGAPQVALPPNDFIVVRQNGKPFLNAWDLTNNWAWHRANNPELIEHEVLKLSLHGLRATAVCNMRQAGVSALLIQNFVGMSRNMIDTYSAMADQIQNSIAAMEAMKRAPKKPADVVPLPLRKETD